MSSVNTVSFLCQSYSFLNNKPKKTLSFGSLSGSLSMGFSRQEYWSGLPFPFPLQEKANILHYNSMLLTVCELIVGLP